MDRLKLTAQTDFCSSHSLVAPEHRREELGEVCDIEHGHQYFLRASFEGQIDPKTGLMISRAEIQTLLEDCIRLPLHNRNLNKIFKQTSGEAIAKWCYESLQSKLSTAKLTSVELIETKKNGFHYPAL